MTWNYIPMQVDLHKRREVIEMASRLKISRYEVIGLLLVFWGWISDESVDGRVDVDVDALVAALGVTREFFGALEAAGWLKTGPGWVEVPNFDRWLSKGAKARLQRNLRQTLWRKNRGNVDAHVDGETLRARLPQDKTRQEKRLQRAPGTKKPHFAREDLALAEYIADGVRSIDPLSPIPNLEGWANTIRLMVERDNRTRTAIRELFTWANADSFWRATILSPDSLRKHWTKLVAQRQRCASARDGSSGLKKDLENL